MLLAALAMPGTAAALADPEERKGFYFGLGMSAGLAVVEQTPAGNSMTRLQFGGGVNRRLTIGAMLDSGLYFGGDQDYGFYAALGPRFTLFPTEIFFVALGAGAAVGGASQSGDTNEESSGFSPGLDLNASAGLDFLFAKHFALILSFDVGGRIFATAPNALVVGGGIGFRIY